MHSALQLPDVLTLCVVVVAVAIAARHSRVPYTVGLVLAGLLIGLIPGHPALTLTPALVMLVFLPALLFAGAWTYPRGQLRKQWFPIALLATAGVLVCMLVCWFVLGRFAHVNSHTALLFGAMVAATDPVAVLAVFRSLKTNRGLAAIVEGESLFNDATAVVAFKVTLVMGIAAAPPLGVRPAIEFVELFAGGALVGALIGLFGLLVLRLTDDYMVEAMGTLIIAYGSYYVADRLGASGLIAVIVAGLLVARVGTRFGSLTTTRQSVNQLWEFIAFLANSILFLLVGMSIDLGTMSSALAVTGWAIAAVAAARVLTVYGLSAVTRVAGWRMPAAWQHVLFLGGLRGALSMALALSLPSSYPDRGLLISMVFSVVLFTIVVQGLALAPAIVRFRLQGQVPDASEP